MICVSHLTKFYGDHLAVDDISFEITEGHVYGFLGPNGAGKSTTMNIMTGCLSPSGGKVLIDGHDIFEDPDAAKRCIGYLPEHPPLYISDTPVEYLRFVGQAKGLKGAALTEQVDLALARTGLSQVKNRRIAQLSKGYKQRVGIAQALLGNPKVIILDEPTVGLDPIQIIEIRQLITDLGKTHTVIFSSHILSEVQAICDRIIMIANGKLVAFGAPDTLQKQLIRANGITITTNAPQDRITDILSQISGIADISVSSADQTRTTAHLCLDAADLYETSASVFAAFRQSEYVLYELALQQGSLEDVFIELSERPDEDVPEANLEKEDAL